MSRSKARLAADWFAKLRINAQTQEVEHADVATVEAEVVAVSDSVSTTVSSQLTSVADDVATVSSDVTAVADSVAAVSSDVTSLSNTVASKLNASAYTAADVIAKVKTVDGAGSGLDADTLDGNHASAFALAAHSHTGYTPLDHMRSTGNGYHTSTTTADLLSELIGDGAFDSYFSTHKTGWSYAGNGDLTDAGRLTELAGSSWAWWTDNPSDGVQGNVTGLVIAPNTGGSAGKVFIYNNQGSGYDPGWREVWTSRSDGAGSGLDADLLDGKHASAFGTMDVTTLSNVAGSRSNNTWYRNTTGKPLIVSIQTTGWNGRVLVGPSTGSYTEVSKNSAGGSGAYEQDNHTFVVPNNWYYYYAGGNRNQWVEYS